MTLQEAVKTGKPFKRPSWRLGTNGDEPWVECQTDSDSLHFVSFPHHRWMPRTEDLIADDYQVLELDCEEKVVRDLAKANTIEQFASLVVRAKALVEKKELPF